MPSFKEDCEEALIYVILQNEDSFFHKKYLKEGNKISVMRLFHYLPNSQATKEVYSMKKLGSSDNKKMNSRTPSFL